MEQETEYRKRTNKMGNKNNGASSELSWRKCTKFSHLSHVNRQKLQPMMNNIISLTLVITSASLCLLSLASERAYTSSAHKVATSVSRRMGTKTGELSKRQVDFDDQLVDERADQMLPDSIYKTAPLLFGADIISDYFTEPDDRATAAPAPLPKSNNKKSNSKAQSKEVKVTNNKLASKRNNNNGSNNNRLSPPPPPSKSPSSLSLSAKRNMAENLRAARLSGADVPEKTMGALREMAKSGASIDQVINSLELVVEAMKQQTMAMQMISGQMAASAKGSSDQLQQAASSEASKALMDTFTEMISNFRGVRAATKSTGGQVDSFGEPVIGSTKGDRGDGDDAVVAMQPQQTDSPAESQTPTAATTTTTTTTTTTSAPATRQSSTTSSTTTATSTTTTAKPTTSTPAPASSPAQTTPISNQAPETTTAEALKKTTNVPLSTNTDSSRYMIMPYSANPQLPAASKGWRRVVPLDFYSFPGLVGGASSEKVAQGAQMMPNEGLPMMPMEMSSPLLAEKQGLSLSYSSFGHPASASLGAPMKMATSTNDNFRSVGMPSYGASGAGSSGSSGGGGGGGSHEKQRYKQQDSMEALAMMQPHFMSLLQQQYKQQQEQRYQQQQQQQQQQQSQHNSMMAHPQMGYMMGAADQNGNLVNHMIMGMPVFPSTSTASPVKDMAQRQKMMMGMIMSDQMDQEQQFKAMADQSAGSITGGGGGGGQWIVLGGQPQQVSQSDDSMVSDEIPKLPVVHMRAPNAATKTRPVVAPGKDSGIKLGERPKFDPSNFQMLQGNGEQQRKLPVLLKTMSSDESDRPQQGNDLSANASAHSSEWNKSGKSEKSMADLSSSASSGTNLKGAAVAPTAGSDKSAPGKLTSFSILGGRFKITPHTQMLHYLLEPSKVLIQQAFGQLMAGTGQQAPPPPRRPRSQRAQRPASAGSTGKGGSSARPARQAKKNGAKSTDRSLSV